MDDETILTKVVRAYECAPLAMLAENGHCGGYFGSHVYDTKTYISNKLKEDKKL